MKDLLTKPADAEPNQILLHNIDKSELLKKMTDLGIIKKSEKIDGSNYSVISQKGKSAIVVQGEIKDKSTILEILNTLGY